MIIKRVDSAKNKLFFLARFTNSFACLNDRDIGLSTITLKPFLLRF